MPVKEEDYIDLEKDVEGRGTYSIKQKQTQITIVDVRTNHQKLKEGKSMLGVIDVEQRSPSLLET